LKVLVGGGREFNGAIFIYAELDKLRFRPIGRGKGGARR
jgi:hypothetical protein